MASEKRLIDVNVAIEKINCLCVDGNENWIGTDNQSFVDHADVIDILSDMPTVDAVEVDHIEEVKQTILQTLDTLIATHRDISNSRFTHSETYLEIPESSNDYYGIYADVMEIARRLVNAAFTDLCESRGSAMRGDS